jgi:rare lipoprotein A
MSNQYRIVQSVSFARTLGGLMRQTAPVGLQQGTRHMALRLTIGASILLLAGSPAMADSSQSGPEEVRKLAQEPPAPPPKAHQMAIDHSGRREAGKVSLYSHKFDGRRMANGKPYDPNSKSAASKSLPLGTEAKVTNLKTGESTTVTVEDRGPFVDGRVLDVTPRAANDIGLTPQKGVAPAIVAPVTVPQPDGSVKQGAGAAPEAEK